MFSYFTYHLYGINIESVLRKLIAEIEIAAELVRGLVSLIINII